MAVSDVLFEAVQDIREYGEEDDPQVMFVVRVMTALRIASGRDAIPDDPKADDRFEARVAQAFEDYRIARQTPAVAPSASSATLDAAAAIDNRFEAIDAACVQLHADVAGSAHRDVHVG